MSNSLYDYICSSIVDGKLPDGFSLPEKGNELVFADGAKDGIYIYHMSFQDIGNEDYAVLTSAVDAAGENKYEMADDLFIKVAEKYSALVVLPRLQNYILNNTETLNAEYIYKYCKEKITTSDNKEHIKMCLLMLELLKTNNDDELRNIIRTLALSDEFTLFCIYIMKTWVNGNEEIFNAAKKVRGWGKIFAVEELRALDPLYDEIREWFLKEGINNDVMPSYSALSCWKNGNVGSTLYTNPTYEQFTYIGKIIDAMMDESAVQGLSALDKRKEIIMVFLSEAQKMPLSIKDYEVIYDIYNYFKEIEDSNEILSLANSILTTAQAKSVITNTVKNGEAIDLAIMCGIEYKSYVFSSIKYSFKDNNYLCEYLMDDKYYRKQLLDIFRNNLPLKKMVSLPGDTLGLSEKYSDHRILETLLEELRDYPLEGTEFVETGLQCEPVRTRNSAISVLQSWVSKLNKPLSEILPDMNMLLIMLSGLEVEESIRNKMDSLISGNIEFKEDIFVIEEKSFSKKTLDILADAISDIGCWTWWSVYDDTVQVEFNDVQLYDYTKKEKEAHSSLIALRFDGNSFFTVLDNLDNQDEKKWYEKICDDEIPPFEIESYQFEFNNVEYVNEMLDIYKNKTSIKDFVNNDDIFSLKYVLAVRCNEVAFIAGGNRLEVVSHNGTFAEEEIEKANKKWWEYWKDYWKLRKSKEAYEKDFACEATIPVDLKS